MPDVRAEACGNLCASRRLPMLCVPCQSGYRAAMSRCKIMLGSALSVLKSCPVPFAREYRTCSSSCRFRTTVAAAQMLPHSYGMVLMPGACCCLPGPDYGRCAPCNDGLSRYPCADRGRPAADIAGGEHRCIVCLPPTSLCSVSPRDHDL